MQIVSLQFTTGQACFAEPVLIRTMFTNIARGLMGEDMEFRITQRSTMEPAIGILIVFTDAKYADLKGQLEFALREVSQLHASTPIEVRFDGDDGVQPASSTNLSEVVDGERERVHEDTQRMFWYHGY